MERLILFFFLFCSAHSAPQTVPVPDFHAIGFPAATFGEDGDVGVQIEMTTEPTTTTSTTTAIPTTSLIEVPPPPVTQPTPSPAGYDIPSPTIDINFMPETPDSPPSDFDTDTVELLPPQPPETTSFSPVPTPVPHPALSPSSNTVDAPPEDLLFLVDSSGSMKSAWTSHLQCVSTIARTAIGRAKIGVIIYSSKYKHRLHIPFALYNDAATLDSMISALPFHGGVTNTGEALFEAVRVLEKERPRRVAVITLTDGYSWDPLELGSEQIREFPGATTYAVALEETIVRRELQILAGSADRIFTESDACQQLAQFLISATVEPAPTEVPTTSPWNPESTGNIGNEEEAHAHFDNGMSVVDETIADDSIARFDPDFASLKSTNYIGSQQNYLPIPRRRGIQCSLDVVFVFDSTSHSGLPSILAASQKLLHSRVFKKRGVRIGAVKFSDGMDSRVVFPLDDASTVPLESILNDDGHRGVEQALHLAAELFREARQTTSSKRVVVVLSDAFDGASAERALDELQSLGASVFVLHSTPISHSFKGVDRPTNSFVSQEDIAKVEQEMENLAKACTRRIRKA